jgi:hypothetical protein
VLYIIYYVIVNEARMDNLDMGVVFLLSKEAGNVSEAGS